MVISTVDEYLAGFDASIGDVLDRVRALIREALPGAVEGIAYGIPSYAVGGRNLVHFAGWKLHISIYPIPKGDEEFAAAIAGYVSGKGTAKFPLDRPIPEALISRLVTLLAAERASG